MAWACNFDLSFKSGELEQVVAVDSKYDFLVLYAVPSI